MKISKKEAQAAIRVYYDSDNETAISAMRAALEAAYTVRKARKAAKRAKAKPDQEVAASKALQPEHRFKVGDRVVHAEYGLGTIASVDGSEFPFLVEYAGSVRRWNSYANLLPEPAAPAWNGKFEVGKAYRTRDGRKAEVADVRIGNKYPINGCVPGIGHRLCWNEYGGFDVYCTEHHLDLIGPWED